MSLRALLLALAVSCAPNASSPPPAAPTPAPAPSAASTPASAPSAAPVARGLVIVHVTALGSVDVDGASMLGEGALEHEVARIHGEHPEQKYVVRAEPDSLWDFVVHAIDQIYLGGGTEVAFESTEPAAHAPYVMGKKGSNDMKELFALTINKDHHLWANQTPMATDADLQRAAAAYFVDHPNALVMITADRHAKFRAVVRAHEAVREAGMHDFAINVEVVPRK